MAAMGRASSGGVAAATVWVLAACHPVEHRGHLHFIGPDTGFMQVNARLECPQTSGDLTRSAVAADGLSCTYNGPNAETVSLQLTPLGGAGPQAVLARLETQLKTDTGLADVAPPAPPPPPPPPGAKAAEAKGPEAKDWDAGGASASSDDSDDNDHDDQDDDGKGPAPANREGTKGDHTKIDLPGLHISTNGDKADVSLPGLSIHANGDHAEVHAGWWGRSATIEGHDGGATIRIGRADRSGVDSVLIVSSDQPSPTGYRAIGYVAKGPPEGPLVVALFKAKSDQHSQHDLAGDGLKKLVQLNVRQGLGWFSDPSAGADRDAKP
jgi:hypothetical protein